MKNERENALDKKFHALSNPTRREILMRLSQKPHSAGEIAGYFQITPASISYHLSLLLGSGEINHSGSGENRQFWSNENHQSGVASPQVVLFTRPAAGQPVSQ